MIPKPLEENQTTIANWAEATFGKASDPSILVSRAAQEMDELLEAVHANDIPEIGKETADVIILLMRLLELKGLNLHDEITKKMQVNRSRKWLSKGDGTGKHIKE